MSVVLEFHKSLFERLTLAIDKGDGRSRGWARSGIGADPARKKCLLLWISCGQQIRNLICKLEAEAPGVLIPGKSHLEINPKFQQIHRNVSGLLSELAHNY